MTTTGRSAGGADGLAGRAVDEASALIDAILPTEAELDDDLRSGPAWRRHPVDTARLVVSVLALIAFLAMALRSPSEVKSVSVDLVNLVNELPKWVEDVLLGVTQLLAIAVPIAMLSVLVRSRRLLAMGVGAALVAAVAMASLQRRVDEIVPNRVVLVTERPSWLFGAAFPSGAYIAAYMAVIIVMGPVLSRGWRRAALGGLAFGVLSRVVTAVAVPLNLAITVSVGALVGSAALAAFGSPRRTASRRAVLGALGSAGFPAVAIEPTDVGAWHAQTFTATSADGRRAFTKLLGSDERSADVLYRMVRMLRVKDLDDERPAWTPARLVNHEAFSGLLAGRNGVQVADVVAVGETPGGDGLLALEVLDATALDDCELEQVTDSVLDLAWGQLAALHDQGIAHRWISAGHLLLTEADPTGIDPAPERVTVIDFRWAVHQASANHLAADVAMLAVSLATIVGAERAVDAAARVLSPDDLARALPLVQRLALPEDVQHAIAGDKGILPLVRGRMQDAAGGAPYELADIERVGARQVAALVGGVFITYSLLSFASNWADIWTAMQQVSLVDLPPLVVLSALPFVLGAFALLAVVPKPLPFWEAVEVMFGQSFLNRFTPANSGGMALRVRYLQKRGVDLGGAAAGVGLTSVASGICQVVVLVAFAAWAGSSAGVKFSLPRANDMAVALLVVALVGGLVWFTPFGRKQVARRVKTSGEQVMKTLRKLSRQPARFVTLFGTTLLGKFAVVAAFALSCAAVDIHLSVPRLGLLYLTASSVAAAAPTPGGVGAVEAALTAALTGVGAPPADALSAVFLFRLLTYWLPVPFGWLALHRLQRTVIA
ncbi:flippase-like domain-containing protein [Aquihabitans sp. McL0605]|uniref:flippase-like domain-containing protein n=1 Tax=Aquihabitans sp. McL0605 TaxID=3415671 RepID=UPI003CF75977